MKLVVEETLEINWNETTSITIENELKGVSLFLFTLQSFYDII